MSMSYSSLKPGSSDLQLLEPALVPLYSLQLSSPPKHLENTTKPDLPAEGRELLGELAYTNSTIGTIILSS